MAWQLTTVVLLEFHSWRLIISPIDEPESSRAEQAKKETTPQTVGRVSDGRFFISADAEFATQTRQAPSSETYQCPRSTHVRQRK